ncbi:hypothetical protein [Winogradskyella sp.]
MKTKLCTISIELIANDASWLFDWPTKANPLTRDTHCAAIQKIVYNG